MHTDKPPSFTTSLVVINFPLGGRDSSRSGRRKVWSRDKRTHELRGWVKKSSSEHRARKHGGVTTESCARWREKSTAIKQEWGEGPSVHNSQVFLFLWSGGFLPSRRKIINTFVVAMPTHGSSVLSVSLFFSASLSSSLSLTMSCQHSWP